MGQVHGNSREGHGLHSQNITRYNGICLGYFNFNYKMAKIVPSFLTYKKVKPGRSLTL